MVFSSVKCIIKRLLKSMFTTLKEEPLIEMQKSQLPKNADAISVKRRKTGVVHFVRKNISTLY